MPWIDVISYEDSGGRLRQLYNRVTGPNGHVDNIMAIHSLRPHTMQSHMTLYKTVLHHSANTVPTWFLETLGVWVSSLNDCSYCVEHHYAGLTRLVADQTRCLSLRRAMENRDVNSAPLDDRQKSAMRYAEVLTLTPSTVTETLVQHMREAGWEDGEILEINQICAYFSYANRTVLGLGCSTDGDVLGLSPADTEDEGDWHHS